MTPEVMGLSSDAYNLLACRALEIVLQHWLVPSNNLRGFDCMIDDLEKRRLPELLERIVEGRLKRLCPQPQNHQSVEEDTIERNNMRYDLMTKLTDEWRYFDINEVDMLLSELSKSLPTEWLRPLESNHTTHSYYLYDTLLDSALFVYEKYWVSVSYSLQHYVINMIIEICELYQTLLIIINTFFHRQRETFHSRRQSTSTILLIYQIHDFQLFQIKYLNLMEKIIFSMIMIPSLMEVEYRDFLRKSLWDMYCYETYGWKDIIPSDQMKNNMIHSTIVEECLLSLRNELLKCIPLRCKILHSDNLHYQEVIDELRLISYELIQLTQHMNLSGSSSVSRNNKNTVVSSKPMYMKRLCDKLSNNSYLKELMNDLYTLRFTIHEQWIPKTKRNSNYTSLQNLMKLRNTEQTFLQEDEYGMHEYYDWNILNQMTELRWQASFYHDLEICIIAYNHTVYKWLTWEVVPWIEATRGELPQTACSEIIELLCAKHSYLSLLVKLYAAENVNVRMDIVDIGRMRNNEQSNPHSMIFELLKYVDIALVRGVQVMHLLRYRNNPPTLVSEVSLSYAHLIVTSLLKATNRYISKRFDCSSITFGSIKLLQSNNNMNIEKESMVLQLLLDRYRLSKSIVNERRRLLKQLIKYLIKHQYSTRSRTHLLYQILQYLSYDHAVLSYYSEIKRVITPSLTGKVLDSSIRSFLIQSIEYGNAIIDQETISGYFDEFCTPEWIDKLKYLLELNSAGKECVTRALSLVKDITLSEEDTMNEATVFKLQEELYLHRLMVSVYRELIRIMRLSIYDYMGFDSDDFPIFGIAKALIKQILPVYYRALSIVRHNGDLNHLQHNTLSLYKCKLLHTIIGIRTMLLLETNALHNDNKFPNYPLRHSDDEESEDDIGNKNKTGKFDDVFYDTLKQTRYVGNMATVPLETIESLIKYIQKRSTNTRTVPVSLQQQLDHTIFWIQKLLECTVLEMESIDFLIGSIDKIDTPFPLRCKLSDIRKCFASGVPSIIINCQDAMNVFKQETQEFYHIVQSGRQSSVLDRESVVSQLSKRINGYLCKVDDGRNDMIRCQVIEKAIQIVVTNADNSMKGHVTQHVTKMANHVKYLARTKLNRFQDS